MIVTPEQFNPAAGTGGDDTLALQAAINSLTQSGGIVKCGAKQYQINGQLAVTTPGITIEGEGRWATILLFPDSTDSSGIIFLGAGALQRINGGSVRNLQITWNRSVGWAITCLYTKDTILRDLFFSAPTNDNKGDNQWGAIWASLYNNLEIEDVDGELHDNGSCIGIFLLGMDRRDPPNGVSSDVAQVSNVTLNCTSNNGGAATGLAYCGAVASLTLSSVRFIGCNPGLLSFANEAGDVPLFINAFDLECEGGKALQLDAFARRTPTSTSTRSLQITWLPSGRVRIARSSSTTVASPARSRMASTSWVAT